jgi:hypothetical protein
MQKKIYLQILSLVIAGILPYMGHSQEVPGTYRTTWIGDTYSAGESPRKWVQNYTDAIAVTPEGRVFCNSYWDEAGRKAGIYQDGDVIGNLGSIGNSGPAGGFSIAVNSTHVFLMRRSNDVQRFNLDGTATVRTFPLGQNALGLAANDDYLVATGQDDHKIRVFSIADATLLHSWDAPEPGAVTIAPDGTIWVVTNITRPGKERAYWTIDTLNSPRILRYSISGELLTGEITGYSNRWIPTCLAIDNQGRLLVGDAGPKGQIRIYDINNQPALVGTFGQEGGIRAGVPGVIEPDKFYELIGCGTDSEGNYYVQCGYRGIDLRKLTPAGDQVWNLLGLFFTDNVDADPFTDATQVYGTDERFIMDYSKTNGQEWEYVGYTKDINTYPDDPRKGVRASVFVRKVQGHRLLYETHMYADILNVFSFEPNNDIAVLAHVHKGGWALEADREGNIWDARDGIRKTPLVGFDPTGKPIFGQTERISDFPEDFNSVMRLKYDSDMDRMYISGYTPTTGGDEGSWGIVGKVLARYDDWSQGNRTSSVRVNVPFDLTTDPLTHMKAMDIAGDYVFFAGIQTRGITWVYSINTGEFVGQLIPGPEVGGNQNTGWIDIPYGVRATQRANGEYVIFIEEDNHGKIMVYRWCPEGDCKNSTFYLASPGHQSYIRPDSQVVFDIVAGHEDGIARVEVYANDLLVGEDSSAPYKVIWEDAPVGEYIISMKLFTTNDAEVLESVRSTLHVGNQKPLIYLFNSDGKTFFDINSPIELIANAYDADGSIDSVRFYLDSALLATVTSEPFVHQMELTKCNLNSFVAVAFDNDGDSTVSSPLLVSVNLPGSGEGSIYREMWKDVPGITLYDLMRDLRYPLTPTETSYEQIFSAPRDVGDDYGLRMRGLLIPPSTGDFTFWISSDDYGALLLSSDDTPENKQIIAEVNGWTHPEEWDKYPEQKSSPVTLQENQPYYIEAIFKEKGGGDHLTVAWEGPCVSMQVIKGIYLSPYTGAEPETGFSTAITNPIDNDTIVLNQSLTANIHLSGDTADVVQLIYFLNNKYMGNVTDSPYSMSVNTSAEGDFTLLVRALDANFMIADSEPVNYTIIDTTSTGNHVIPEQSGPGLLFYPNPWGSGLLTVEWLTAPDFLLTLTSITGRVVRKVYAQNGKVQLPGDNLSPGVYILKVSSDKKMIVRKVIVK